MERDELPQHDTGLKKHFSFVSYLDPVNIPYRLYPSLVRTAGDRVTFVRSNGRIRNNDGVGRCAHPGLFPRVGYRRVYIFEMDKKFDDASKTHRALIYNKKRLVLIL